MQLADWPVHRIATDAAEIPCRIAGTGPPLVLLHGFPQTGYAWRKLAPALAERHTVIVPDLRGYGASRGPGPDPAHSGHAKRAMATDVVRVLDALGYGSAQVAGHDRGARVAYRLALDHPERVDRLALLSILPTLEMCERLTAESAITAYHWFFLAQPSPFPETFLGARSDFFVDWTIGSWLGDPAAIADDALETYRAAFRDPAVIQAACEDYRAGLTLDLAHDRADREGGKLITCPTHVVWGTEGLAARTADPLDIWKGWALEISATPLDCGHFPAEERPQETLDALTEFFRAA